MQPERHLLNLILFFLVFTGCRGPGAVRAPTQPHGTTPISNLRATPSTTPTPTRVATMDRVPPIPTKTLHLSNTLAETPPALETPSPEARCPEPVPPSPALITTGDLGPIDQIFVAPIKAYLDAGGDPLKLGARLRDITLSDGSVSWQSKAHVFHTDVTGDSVPELVMDLVFFQPGGYADGYLFVFRCQGGAYRGGAVTWIGGQVLSADDPGPGIRAIEDMNANGVPEIVISRVEVFGTHANHVRQFQILEWEERQFASRIQAESAYPGAAEVLNGDGNVQDFDGDGIPELILNEGVGRGPEASLLDRPRKKIWGWSGEAFELVCSRAQSAPLYRFQAIYDGDDATVCGAYEDAEHFYQEAIFNQDLAAWSPGRLASGVIRSDREPTPDPEETPHLGAYARYRLMILHALRGWPLEAQTVFETLQMNFTPGEPGHVYAALATQFWGVFQASGDVSVACNAAQSYAERRAEEILDPLGISFYGAVGREYRPKDICPLTVRRGEP
jgi:hypothetical protein